jgi:hypothetical protein
MPKICYVPREFSPGSLQLIEQANTIVETYARQGFDLTLRQLYYQFVSRGLIANRQSEYKRLGSVVNDARLAGLIDWNRIEDRTRNLSRNPSWDTPGDIIESAAASYGIDKWEDQEYRPEVWIEKDALVGVIEGVCGRLDVPFLSCRGYTSQSEMWRGAMRLAKWKKAGQTPFVIHLGDHDPSGKDMSRDIRERLALFMGGVEFERIALNMNQVEQYDPPPNPAKLTDSRCEGYIAEFGDESWELDALEPAVIADLIEKAIYSVRDADKWAAKVEEEDRGRQLLRQTSERWDEVEELLA